MHKFLGQMFQAPFVGPANDAGTGNANEILIPEVWVREALYQTTQTRVASGLVWTDFSDEVARFGQVIHANRPSDMVASRKKDGDDVKTVKAKSTGVDVKLNQWAHVSFLIYDAEMSLSFVNLVEKYLVPASKAITQFIDEAICTQVYQYIGVVESGSLDSAITKATITNTRRKLLKKNVDNIGMAFLVGPDSEAQILNIDSLNKVNEAGDGGMALRNAFIGKLFGFTFYTTQNVPSVGAMTAASPDPVKVNNAAGYPKGHTGNIALDGIVTALVAGQWIKFSGEGAPRRIATVTALSAGAQTVTLVQPLTAKILDNADVSAYPFKATTAQFAADYIDDIKTAAFTDALQRGQLASFGTVSGVYGLLTSPETVKINGVDETYVATTHATLDVPVATTIPNSTNMCVGPDGNYNFAFHRNSLVLVSRPPAAPSALALGVMSMAAAYEGLALRITMSYDAVKQGTRITLDTFFGVKVIDDRLGAVIFANAD